MIDSYYYLLFGVAARAVDRLTAVACIDQSAYKEQEVEIENNKSHRWTFIRRK